MRNYIKRNSIRGLMGVAVCAGMIGFWLLSAPAHSQSNGATQTAQVPAGQTDVLDQLSKAYIAVAQTVRPAVVSIEVTQKIKLGRDGDSSGDDEGLNNSDNNDNGDNNDQGLPPGLRDQLPPELRQFFNQRTPQEYSREGLGSGIIVDAQKGYILTNNHVVKDASNITVTLNDNREFKAKVIGADKSTDVAVVQIEGAKNLTQVKLGTSGNLEVGEIVMAIGSPFALGGTVTQGIISAKNRQTGILGQYGYEDFIQTDAAVNPGNSGGPLVNLHGEVVGMNTAIATGTGAFAGVSFAVPIDLAKSVMNDLITKGKVTRGYVGVEIGPIDAMWAKRLGLETPYGALVNSVTDGGPAEKAGLKEGDVILQMNGKKVEDYSTFRYDIGQMAPGTKVPLVILRDGKQQNVEVTLSERPSDQQLSKLRGGNNGNAEEESTTQSNTATLKRLGFSVKNLAPDEAKTLGMSTAKGVLITSVDPGSPAALKGLQPQMVITRVEKTDVNSVQDLRQALDQAMKANDGNPILLRVWFQGGESFVLIEPTQAQSSTQQ